MGNKDCKQFYSFKRIVEKGSELSSLYNNWIVVGWKLLDTTQKSIQIVNPSNDRASSWANLPRARD